jgi:predicted CXXCH cytochrome family protein
MRVWKVVLLACLLVTVASAIVALMLRQRGFAATSEPSRVESVLARTVRNFAIPSQARRETNPLESTSANLNEGREDFLARCAGCHGDDGSGRTPVGRGLYPRVPDLRAADTQNLTDGEIHYIIDHGVQLTGMPAWGGARQPGGTDTWMLTMFVRSLRPLTPAEQTEQAHTVASATYVGSQACEKCHADVYDRWKKTPMANIVRDPGVHPEAIIPDLATNTVAPFSKDQVAFVYGSIWKQRYFTKVGSDYFPLPVQWEIGARKWSKYVVPPGADWWTAYYPADNMHRPTGPTCDGCHSVGYDIHTKQVAEWNVGCERCHGPGSAHAAHPTRGDILNPARLTDVAANDTCIQCHSQGRPVTSPIEGQYYDWPVGYQVGRQLQDSWTLERHSLGVADFYYFADGTAHKNRMQGNDFVQSVMYRRGITCATCHDVHGTANDAQLRAPAQTLCLQCHGPSSPNGPRTATIEEHTHHKADSPGSQCVACHMPRIETEGVPGAFVRAHTFRFITPAETDKYAIPNACTTCHTGQSTAWAAAAMRAWPERSPWRLQ